MINDIVNGISMQLYDQYGEECEIYSEKVEQDLQEPCFYIKVLPIVTRALLGRRKQVTYSFDIHYFTSGSNEEIMQVSEELVGVLEYIKLQNEDILRGKDINCEVTDGVLHFKIDYDAIWNCQSAKTPMEEHGLRVNMKG